MESDLTKALSMKPFNLSKLIDKVPHVKHKIGIRIIQPFADKPKEDAWRLFARNTYILFSNEMETFNGSWDNDKVLMGGWSILGNINVE